MEYRNIGPYTEKDIELFISNGDYEEIGRWLIYYTLYESIEFKYLSQVIERLLSIEIPNQLKTNISQCIGYASRNYKNEFPFKYYESLLIKFEKEGVDLQSGLNDLRSNDIRIRKRCMRNLKEVYYFCQRLWWTCRP